MMSPLSAGETFQVNFHFFLFSNGLKSPMRTNLHCWCLMCVHQYWIREAEEPWFLLKHYIIIFLFRYIASHDFIASKAMLFLIAWFVMIISQPFSGKLCWMADINYPKRRNFMLK